MSLRKSAARSAQLEGAVSALARTIRSSSVMVRVSKYAPIIVAGLAVALVFSPLNVRAAAAQTPPVSATSTPAPQAAPSQSEQHIINEMLDTKMSLGDGHKLWHPTRRQLGLIIILGASPKIEADPVKAKTYLASLAKKIQRGPSKAHIIFPNNYPLNEVGDRSSSVPLPVKIAPALPGVSLDVDGSVKAIRSAIAADPATTHIVLAVNTTPIPIAEQNALSGINARIGHFVTHYNPGEKGRTQTVHLAISMIDGSIVQPGQQFSVNKSVGERTAARGFGKGIVFVGGHLDTQLGGGMCQVSTTLFNAALLANLKIIQRYQHVRTVPYVKPGQDATVYYGQKDFIFKNNTATPIYISYKTTATHCICDLYGKADPSAKVRIDDKYQKLGPRYYKAILKRYVSENGKTKVDYTAKSAYKWTPALDFSM